MIRKMVTVIVFSAAWHAYAESKDGYPQMAPVDQYMMTRDGEMAMARTAAPKSISQDAEILILETGGYTSAVAGKNGFVCLVMRSWAAGTDDPEFWNQKVRSPICVNPAAARSYLPLVVKRTEWVLAGRTKAQILDSTKIAFDRKEIPAIEAGAMGYMMSKEQHLNDEAGHWHPHLMFYIPPADVASWGVGLAGSPVFGFKEYLDRVTVFVVAVGKWSDGSDVSAKH